MMFKFTKLQLITLTAVFLALDIIATRFLGVYITPYVRLSVGVSITIYSSILLGPISGALIGGGADILGILLYNASGVAINPFMTIAYAIMGAVPGLFIILFKKIKMNDKLSFIIFNSFLILIWIGILIFALNTTSIKIFNNVLVFNLVAKILIPVISFIVMILISLFFVYMDKKFKKNDEEKFSINFYQIGFIVLFIEVVFTLFINTFIKVFFYGIAFEVIFFPALLLAFIYIPLNTSIDYFMLKLTSKIYKNHN